MAKLRALSGHIEECSRGNSWQATSHSNDSSSPKLLPPSFRLQLASPVPRSRRRKVVSSFSLWNLFAATEPLPPASQSVVDDWANIDEISESQGRSGVYDTDIVGTEFPEDSLLQKYWQQLQSLSGRVSDSLADSASRDEYSEQGKNWDDNLRDTEACERDSPSDSGEVETETPSLRRHQHFRGNLAMASMQVNPSHLMLVSQLRKYGILHAESAIRAMSDVDRGLFVPQSGDPYEDCPQYIGYHATISAPHMHAECLQLLSNHLQVSLRAIPFLDLLWSLTAFDSTT